VGVASKSTYPQKSWRVLERVLFSSPTTSLLVGFSALLSDRSHHVHGVSGNCSFVQASLRPLLEPCEMGEVVLEPPLMDRDPDSLEGGMTCLRLCNLSACGHAAISSLDMEMCVWFKLAG